MMGNASVVTAMPSSPTACPRKMESTMLYSALNVIMMMAGMENSSSSFKMLFVPRRSVVSALRPPSADSGACPSGVGPSGTGPSGVCPSGVRSSGVAPSGMRSSVMFSSLMRKPLTRYLFSSMQRSIVAHDSLRMHSFHTYALERWIIPAPLHIVVIDCRFYAVPTALRRPC